MTNEFAIALLKQDIQNSKINISYRHNEVGIKALELAIQALEQQPSEDCISSSGNTNKWIPVSERLPKENISVIGTTKYDDIYETELYDDCGEKKWYADGNYDVPIVAWMPLPEPYKESEGVCKDCYYNDGEVHAECVICDKTERGE